MREFLEKMWWQGVGGIVGIIALALFVLQLLGKVNISWLGLSITVNIILAISLALVAIWAIRLNRKYEDVIGRYEDVRGRIEKIQETLKEKREKTERKRVFLPDKNEIWRLDIDNTLLTELHGQAYGLAIRKFHDAKLSGLSILVQPYQELDRVTIFFSFYSRWADRECDYMIAETADIVESQPSKVVRSEEDRRIFDELPWVKDPNWPQFVRKSCEKVGPLSPAGRTGYYLSALAGYEPQWRISFDDGVTGKESHFSWDGKGNPIPEERV